MNWVKISGRYELFVELNKPFNGTYLHGRIEMNHKCTWFSRLYWENPAQVNYEMVILQRFNHTLRQDAQNEIECLIEQIKLGNVTPPWKAASARSSMRDKLEAIR